MPGGSCFGRASCTPEVEPMAAFRMHHGSVNLSQCAPVHQCTTTSILCRPSMQAISRSRPHHCASARHPDLPFCPRTLAKDHATTPAHALVALRLARQGKRQASKQVKWATAVGQNSLIRHALTRRSWTPLAMALSRAPQASTRH